MGDFRKLKVWQEAEDLSVEIYKITGNGKFAKDFIVQINKNRYFNFGF